MFEITLHFSIIDAKQLLESAGLTVQVVDIEQSFTRPHNDTYSDMIPTWCVINPHTQQPTPIDGIFKKYIDNRKKSLFLSCENRLEIFNLFDKK